MALGLDQRLFCSVVGWPGWGKSMALWVRWRESGDLIGCCIVNQSLSLIGMDEAGPLFILHGVNQALRLAEMGRSKWFGGLVSHDPVAVIDLDGVNAAFCNIRSMARCAGGARLGEAGALIVI